MSEDDHSADSVKLENPETTVGAPQPSPAQAQSSNDNGPEASAAEVGSARTAPSKPGPAVNINSPAKPATTAKPATPVKTAATPVPPPQPFKAPPSIPLSMTNAPGGSNEADGPVDSSSDEEFDREIEQFESRRARRRSFAARLLGGWNRGGGKSRTDEVRGVAFDGYRDARYDDKLERDRRYGTVYKVTESAEAYLVRLELPRYLPATSLKQVWHLDTRPAYDYTIQLDYNVVAIRARLRGEGPRRLAYVSPSYPSGFLTRIELAEPVTRFKHRLRGQSIEVIAYKGASREDVPERATSDLTVQAN
jgi:hypothetical protein